MKLKTLIATATFALASAASQAGVIYEWVTIDNNNLPTTINSRIEFDDAAVQKGSFKLRLEAGKVPVGDAGLISYLFKDSVNIGPNHQFYMDIGYLDIDVAFMQNNYFLTGTIRAANWDTRVNMSTQFMPQQDARVFTLYDTDGDSIIGCGMTPARRCEGATGYFRQVPEPASAALLGLGLVGALAARRCKRKA